VVVQARANAQGRVLARIESEAECGLTVEQAQERFANGYANVALQPPERTTLQIVADNVFTYFNLIFLALSAAVIAVGAFKELTFLPVVVINSVIGIFQELRSRAALRKMKFLTAPKAVVIRGGAEVSVSPEETVLDDVAVFTPGNQIYADAVVLDGQCQVNEALVTGEADEITKNPGDKLLSGSFIVSGKCRARLDKVGRDSFVSKLTLEAKRANHKVRGAMMHDLTRLIKLIGVVIIPFGAIMLFQQLRILHEPLEESVVTTSAALIGMIPEGLYFLVSVALAVSVMRLARRRTLVQEMRCIESLARVDVLCVDKTGTITEPEMLISDVIPLAAAGMPKEQISQIISDYAAGTEPDNDTMAAMKKFFTMPPKSRLARRMPFSPVSKYAGFELSGGQSYVVGAPERIMADCGYDGICDEVEKYAAQGYRVLLLAKLGGGLLAAQDGIKDAEPVGLVLLTNKIRDNAPKTFRFFAEQGVMIKVISGDNPATVSRIAQDAGIADAERYIDATTLKTERHIKKAAVEYTVFGRVTPDMKRRLIRALRADGHTVAMTGDGVNDVLALKDADCAVAMASGSDVACHVAQLVLLDSDFAAMPAVVLEGRRVINNIERSSSLFLMKNIFSFALTLWALIIAMKFPFTPTHLTLYSATFIGIPSFVLAMEPNKSIVRGRFLPNVLLSALPAGLTDLACVVGLMYLGRRMAIPEEQLSTMATIAIAFVGLLMMLKVSRPMNNVRKALVIAMPVLFALGAATMPELFNMTAITGKNIWLTVGFCLGCVPVMLILCWLAAKLKRALRLDKPARLKRRKRVKI
jgi:cation-transporting ATPase E